MSFIKLDQELYGSRFFVVREEDCGMYGECGAIIETRENGRYGASIHVFKSEEEAGEYARQYWEDYVECECSEDVVNLLGAETLISWALGRSAGPGTSKVNSLEEWLDLYIDTPEEHFEEEYEI